MDISIKSLFKQSSEAFFIRFLGIVLNYFYLYTIAKEFGTTGVGIFVFYSGSDYESHSPGEKPGYHGSHVHSPLERY